jgi:hypothetical protein
MLREMARVGRLLLALCGILGPATPPGDLAGDGARAAAEAQLSDRIERARRQLLGELGAQEASPEPPRRLAQWYNWPNWSNWQNGWRNW